MENRSLLLVAALVSGLVASSFAAPPPPPHGGGGPPPGGGGPPPGGGGGPPPQGGGGAPPQGGGGMGGGGGMAGGPPPAARMNGASTGGAAAGGMGGGGGIYYGSGGQRSFNDDGSMGPAGGVYGGAGRGEDSVRRAGQPAPWEGGKFGLIVEGFTDDAVDAIKCGSTDAGCKVPDGMILAYNAKSDCDDCLAFVTTNGKSITVSRASDGRPLKRYGMPKGDDWSMIGRWIARDFKPGSGFLAQAEGDDSAGPSSDSAAAGGSAKAAKAAARSDGLTKEDVAAIVESAVEKASGKKKKEAAKAEPASDVDVPVYQEDEKPQNYAVVVGIEKYADLPDAQYAERDARAVKDHLLALGVPERNIMLLTGSRASRAGLAKNLDSWLPNHVAKNSTVFFYYSGHGAPDPRTGLAYLLPADGDPQYLADTAYPVKTLYEKLGALKAKKVVVALDSCFSGAGGRSVLPQGTRPLVTKADTGSVGGKIVSLAASAQDEISGADGGQGHGLFTYYLLKGLNGAAARGSGHVTVKGLYQYLSPHVQDAARRDNRSQTPQLLPASLDDDVVLR